MRFLLILFLMLAANTAPATAQTLSPDSQMAQSMLMEIRELRRDLQNTAASIQRVQIVMYRLQAQAALLDRATQRLEQARNECKQTQAQQKLLAADIEQAETRKRNSQNASDQTAADQIISQLQSSLETSNSEMQQCQVEQSDAESQFRAEQSKMTELQDQLDQLDQVLAGHARK